MVCTCPQLLLEMEDDGIVDTMTSCWRGVWNKLCHGSICLVLKFPEEENVAEETGVMWPVRPLSQLPR